MGHCTKKTQCKWSNIPNNKLREKGRGASYFSLCSNLQELSDIADITNSEIDLPVYKRRNLI